MIKPLGDRVVIEVAEVELKTKSGIIMPETSKKEKLLQSVRENCSTTELAQSPKSKKAMKFFSISTRAAKSKWTTKNIS